MMKKLSITMIFFILILTIPLIGIDLSQMRTTLDTGLVTKEERELARLCVEQYCNELKYQDGEWVLVERIAELPLKDFDRETTHDSIDFDAYGISAATMIQWVGTNYVSSLIWEFHNFEGVRFSSRSGQMVPNNVLAYVFSAFTGYFSFNIPKGENLEEYIDRNDIHFYYPRETPLVRPAQTKTVDHADYAAFGRIIFDGYADTFQRLIENVLNPVAFAKETVNKVGEQVVNDWAKAYNWMRNAFDTLQFWK